MVLTALEATGWGAGPKELQPVIKEKFGVELASNVISTYKSNLKREGGKGGRKRGRKGSPQFSDLEAVRELVNKFGADQVKKLVDVAETYA
jgi:hypothetical protein